MTWARQPYLLRHAQRATGPPFRSPGSPSTRRSRCSARSRRSPTGSRCTSVRRDAVRRQPVPRAVHLRALRGAALLARRALSAHEGASAAQRRESCSAAIAAFVLHQVRRAAPAVSSVDRRLGNVVLAAGARQRRFRSRSTSRRSSASRTRCSTTATRSSASGPRRSSRHSSCKRGSTRCADSCIPHFIFNTLNAAATLMHEDVDGADQMLSQLGDLLRTSLDRSAAEVTLDEELERGAPISRRSWARRFSDRLTVSCVADPSVRNAMVPTFFIQPLIENALEHGIARRPGPGRVEISARRHDGTLEVVVADDGPGVGATARHPASACRTRARGSSTSTATRRRSCSRRRPTAARAPSCAFPIANASRRNRRRRAARAQAAAHDARAARRLRDRRRMPRRR